ncbi:hypothetical protein HDG35_000660 [Paraburkholderia sp. JPY681]|nr:hypothetical protein [Paraburkholderia atlantica]
MRHNPLKSQQSHEWLAAQRKLVSEGSAIAKALDYSLKRREALTRYLDDGNVPIDNNDCHAASGMSKVMATPRLCRVVHARGGGYGLS